MFRAPSTCTWIRATTGRWSDVVTPVADVYTSGVESNALYPPQPLATAPGLSTTARAVFRRVVRVERPAVELVRRWEGEVALVPPVEHPPSVFLMASWSLAAHDVQHAALQEHVHGATITLDAIVEITDEDAQVEAVGSAPSLAFEETTQERRCRGVGRTGSIGVTDRLARSTAHRSLAPPRFLSLFSSRPFGLRRVHRRGANSVFTMRWKSALRCFTFSVAPQVRVEKAQACRILERDTHRPCFR